MTKGLVIVESPTKVRTLKKYLGKDFNVAASLGHIKDLPKNRLGVNIEQDFQPEYEVIRGKAKVIKDLKQQAAQVEHIYLAPDPDREGEAIAWHLAHELQDKKRKQRFYRVLFHELTERAIQEAMASPGELSQSRFESQQARRILDRLVGYQISPILWDKVKRGLSAGRVQSVALRLICDREREIMAFVPQEYWTLDALLQAALPPDFSARVVSYRSKKLTMGTERDARQVEAALKQAVFQVVRVQKKERKKNPPPPFITSTLQQEAAKRLRFSAKKTMSVAQGLYEGVELGTEGPVGLITYMRTDSTRISQEAAAEAKEWIVKEFGQEYAETTTAHHKKVTHAQDAHEAIRPTSVWRHPDSLKGLLDRDALALYELIWRRFVASQMSPAILDQTQVDIKAGDYGLRVTGTVMRFPGFTSLYIEKKDETQAVQENSTSTEVDLEDAGKVVLPPLKEGDVLTLKELISKQHFTQPPPRYTEASLIKALEENGIGRPSTYATILSNIQNKDYVEMRERQFHPTELGMLVVDLLVKHFSQIMDVGFTADMERRLDAIEEGTVSWLETLKGFYSGFQKALENAREQMVSLKRDGIKTGIVCEKCGGEMVIKYGKNGEFLACANYPECKNTSNFTRNEQGEIVLAKDAPVPDRPSSEVCEKCGGPMVIKNGRFGEFLACSNYPDCKNTRPISLGIPCPKPDCDGMLVKKRSRTGKFFYGCNRYPECDFALWDEPVSGPCPICNNPLLVVKYSKDGKKYLKCPAQGCKYKQAEQD
jgi:DNA topoisomerase-1